MNRAFQGRREDGIWEQFEWDEVDDPTTEETGYTEIEELMP